MFHYDSNLKSVAYALKNMVALADSLKFTVGADKHGQLLSSTLSHTSR